MYQHKEIILENERSISYMNITEKKLTKYYQLNTEHVKIIIYHVQLSYSPGMQGWFRYENL